MPRQAPRAYRVKMRAFAKFALQFKHEKQLIELAAVAAAGMILAKSANIRRMYFLTAATCIAEIYRINTIFRGLILPIEQRVVLFATQNEALFPINHRFRLHNMRKLAYCLRMPANFKLDNGSFVQGEHHIDIIKVSTASFIIYHSSSFITIPLPQFFLPCHNSFALSQFLCRHSFV